jgi:hypothetical protein
MFFMLVTIDKRRNNVHYKKNRKLLAEVLLPKEAQQIDRAMEDFAKRYYECNPGLVDNPGKEKIEALFYRKKSRD